MVDQRKNRRRNADQIPQRVENAAQSMAEQASAGPRRGYIPPETVMMQHQGGSWQNSQNPWQNTGANQPMQPGFQPRQPGGYPYQGVHPVTGNQRGYFVPPDRNQSPQPQKKHKGLICFAVILLLAALGTGGYFAAYFIAF